MDKNFFLSLGILVLIVSLGGSITFFVLAAKLENNFLYVPASMFLLLFIFTTILFVPTPPYQELTDPQNLRESFLRQSLSEDPSEIFGGFVKSFL